MDREAWEDFDKQIFSIREIALTNSEEWRKGRETKEWTLVEGTMDTYLSNLWTLRDLISCRGSRGVGALAQSHPPRHYPK